jgi:protein involved in polysaccharide export with SLBB domain
VKKGGAFDYRSGLTLRDLVALAGGIPDSADAVDEVLVSRLQPDLKPVQIRIPLRDATGQVNPFPAQAGDEFLLSSRSEFSLAPTVAIWGAVKKSVRVPYRAGMTLRDLVQLGGGLSQNALLTQAEVASLPTTRDEKVLAVTRRVPLDSTYLFDRRPDGSYIGVPGIQAPAHSPDVVLKPYDEVLILMQPGFGFQVLVSIQGEVRFPGTYSLLTREDRLSDLIARAGGLTDYAYPDGIQFFRKQDKVGRIDVDGSRLLRDPNSRDNFLLVQGDSIIIPDFSPVVRVFGAVNSPSSVAWVPGRGIDYYVRAAGGASVKADEDRTYVTQPNGHTETVQTHFLRPRSVPTPLAGASVYVPLKEEDKTDYTEIARSVATVVMSGLSLLVLILKN